MFVDHSLYREVAFLDQAAYPTGRTLQGDVGGQPASSDVSMDGGQSSR